MIAFEVKDMSCGHCVSMITGAVKRLDADAKLAFDVAGKRVEIHSSGASEAAMKSAIEAAGYSPTPAGPTPASRAGNGCCGCCH
jgi:copper chaperone